MIRRTIPLIIVGLIFTCLDAMDSSFSVTMVREKLTEQFSKVEDFTVDIKLSVQMTGLRMPKKKITLHYKNPDHFKIESKGFALVPQYGLPLSPEVLLNSLSDITIDSVDEISHRLILKGNIQLGVDKEDIWNFSDKGNQSMTMSVSIDTERWVIPSFEVYAGAEKILRIDTGFSNFENGLFLPVEAVIELDIPEMDANPEFHMREGNAPKSGKITLVYKNYKVNQGLDEAFFLEEPE